MPVLHSLQSGNFTSASTWGVVDSTSFLDSRGNTQGLTTTQTNSSAAFTPGVITIVGVAIQLASRITSPTGTVTMRLWNNTAGSIVKDVTINATDLPNTNGSILISWTYFKFDVPVTLLAATAYTIRMFSSVNSEVVCYRQSLVLNNWSRALITTTTASPINGDTIIISGQHTAAGVNSTYTITMDSTSNTNGYGPLYLGSRSIFQYGTSASTNYKFRLANDMFIGRGATFKIGDSITPIPSTSTAEFEISCTTPGQFSVISYGTFTTYGATVLHRALLNADIASGATTSTTNVTTGWKNGDLIVIPSTTRTITEYELVTLNADSTGTTLTHNATSFAHGGDSTSMVQADLANIRRNIRFFSTSTTNRGYFTFTILSDSSIFYTSFVDFGYSANQGSAGITVLNTINSFNFQYNSVYQTVVGAFQAFFIPASLTLTVSNNVFYNLGTTNFISSSFAVQANLTDNNVLIAMLGPFPFTSTIGNNNVMSSAFYGLIGSFTSGSTGNNIYSCNVGWYISNQNTTTTSNLKIWRCVNNAIVTQNASSNRSQLITVDNLQSFGNGLSIAIGNSARLFIRNSFIWGGSTLVQPFGSGQFTNLNTEQIIYQNCTFGRRPDAVLSAFSTACLASGSYTTTSFYNCSFFGTEAAYSSFAFNQTYMTTAFLSFNHNGVNGDHRQYQIRGLLSLDTTYSVTGKSVKLTPQQSTFKTFSTIYRVAVKSGNTCTVSVQVRKSAAPDTVYNGNQPRLMIVFNPLANILAETVCATATIASNGAWETLTYTSPSATVDCVLEFYVDCDGTAGFINVDDFKTTTYNDTRSGTYLSPIGSYIEPDWRTPGGSYGFFS